MSHPNTNTNLDLDLDEKGVLHVPLAMIATLIVLTGFALWGLLHRWKSLAETQLRLDQCTGEAALELKAKLNQVASINDQMERLRALEAAAAPSSSARTALMLAVNVEATRQEAIRAAWVAKQTKWTLGSFAGSSCGSRGDRSAPLPDLDWERDPPDGLGQVPLTLEELPSSFRFEVSHPPRGSAAEVFRGGQDGTSYYARWVGPRLLLRTSVY